MTRKPKASENQNTQGAKDSLEGTQPEQAKAPITADPQEQAAAPAAEVDPSAATHDAGEDSADAPVLEGASNGQTNLPFVDPAHAVSGDGGRDIPGEIQVTCLLATGRRRAGRRWAAGLTTAGDLTARQIAALRADPAFLVSGG